MTLRSLPQHDQLRSEGMLGWPHEVILLVQRFSRVPLPESSL